MSTLGHELFHAIEIAIEPSIVDARTLAAHYTEIDEEAGNIDGRRTFETRAAAVAGARVRYELLSAGAVSTKNAGSSNLAGEPR